MNAKYFWVRSTFYMLQMTVLNLKTQIQVVVAKTAPKTNKSATMLLASSFFETLTNPIKIILHVHWLPVIIFYIPLCNPLFLLPDPVRAFFLFLLESLILRL